MTTVIVPAHNEASQIAGCLTELLKDAEPNEFDVVVACNGCVDDTAEIALRTADQLGSIRVIEVAQASKAAALNEGLAAARSAPYVFVDADVGLSTDALRLIVKALAEPGVLAASTGLNIDLSEASFLSRSYHRFWEQLPSIRTGLAGRGVYALSAAGLERLGEFPPVLADDRYIDLLFSEQERRSIASVACKVVASRGIFDLISRKVRVFAGNSAIDLPNAANKGKHSWVAVLKANPSSLRDLPVYLGINAFAKLGGWLANRRGAINWNQDASTRNR